jgi:hypothetical protein
MDVLSYPDCLYYDQIYPEDITLSLPIDTEVYELIYLGHSTLPAAVRLSIIYPLKKRTRTRVYRKDPVVLLMPAKYWKIIASRFLPIYCQYDKYTYWENEIKKTDTDNDICINMEEDEAMEWTYYKRLWSAFLEELALWNREPKIIDDKKFDWNGLQSVKLHCWIHREFYGCRHDGIGRHKYLELVEKDKKRPYEGDPTKICKYLYRS